jgi:hypothetical protein
MRKLRAKRLTDIRLQASLRNLVLDITPGEQLASANAWHGRFNHVGNIVGFTMGTARHELADSRLPQS